MSQSRARIEGLLERHGILPRRSLGQHFLADPNIVRRIVRVSGVGPGSQVVEVGPGTGALTLALSETGARVLAFEVDERLRPLLQEALAGREEVELRFADVTHLDLAAELGEGDWVMVANLPYNVGTPILLDALRHVPALRRMVTMVQLEVAERLVAAPGTSAYGLPSVVVGLHATASVAFRVPPQVFVPPPHVGSAVVLLERRPAPPLAEEAIALAGAGFRQRRKMLRGALQAMLPAPAEALRAAGIPETARAEEVPPLGWVRLAEAARG